jgi:ABC-2 type transport system ATP-binding protein
LTRENIKTFIENGVKKILVSSPHCFHTFKNEYSEFKVNFEVVHLSQYLFQLMSEGRLKLTKEFDGLVAVNGVDLEIKKGELFSLLGPNGAGKTTIIRMLCCLLKPTKGSASILGYDIVNMPFAVKKLIGVSPQDTILSERLNCWENLDLIGRVHGLSSSEAKKRSQELLETMGLSERAKDQVRKFSGGMKRRLNLAMALVHDPQIVVLDEPEAGLDPQSRVKVREYIQSLARKKTVILTTHNMDEAERLYC